MIARLRVASFLWLTPALLLAVACQRVPLLAPSGSTITLTSATTALSVNGTADIIAQVIEASGTPPQEGTHVTFTTTLGTIQPPEAETDINGRVRVKFLAGTANGTATIAALSGGATTGANGAIKIAVGTAAVGRVTVSASPATVPAAGGSTTISASVFDINGNVLSSAPVSFSTTAGSLSTTLATTDASGVATTTLTTSQQATVTASVGAQAATTGGGTGTGGGGTGTGGGTTSPTGQASGSVIVNVSAVPTIVIKPPATPPSAGLPASYTFTVTVASTNGSAVRDLTVSWGDGQTQDLGAVTGDAVVAHVYNLPGTYTIRATVIDAAGNTSTVSTAVTVIPVPRPTIIITSSPVPAKVSTQTTITIQVTVPAGIGVVSTVLDFGDSAVCMCNSVANLGGATSAAQPHVYTQQGTYTVTVTVTDTTGQITIGTTAISVGP